MRRISIFSLLVIFTAFAACLWTARVVTLEVAVRATIFCWAGAFLYAATVGFVTRWRTQNNPRMTAAETAAALARLQIEGEKAESMIADLKRMRTAQFVVMVADGKIEPGDLVVIENGKVRRASALPEN